MPAKTGAVAQRQTWRLKGALPHSPEVRHSVRRGLASGTSPRYVGQSVDMSVNPSNQRTPLRRTFARPLVAIVLAYAIVINAVASVAPDLHAAGGNDPGLGFELCAHNSQGGRTSPSEPADRSCVQHCLLCLANLNFAFLAPDGSVALRTPPVSWRLNQSHPPRTSRYAIARPRGPPLSV